MYVREIAAGVNPVTPNTRINRDQNWIDDDDHVVCIAREILMVLCH